MILGVQSGQELNLDHLRGVAIRGNRSLGRFNQYLHSHGKDNVIKSSHVHWENDSKRRYSININSNVKIKVYIIYASILLEFWLNLGALT